MEHKCLYCGCKITAMNLCRVNGTAMDFCKGCFKKMRESYAAPQPDLTAALAYEAGQENANEELVEALRDIASMCGSEELDIEEKALIAIGKYEKGKK